MVNPSKTAGVFTEARPYRVRSGGAIAQQNMSCDGHEGARPKSGRGARYRGSHDDRSCPALAQFAGNVAGAPTSFTIITRILAGFESLALRDTE